mmetsp:Transcript_16855/g.31918  ORF Transcript_16855/g.31918 Transcript_16855/m.31918 type:complete len:384 (-) Transcript_16855:30-1181(-)
MFLRFRCLLSRDVNDGNKSASDHKTFWFENAAGEGDEKKPFSFHIKRHEKNTLSDVDDMKIEKPCFLVIDCAVSADDNIGAYEFKFGAIEVYSNSRNIEVYAVVEGKDANDREYWQTYRGNKIENETQDVEEIFQTVIIPPSSKSTVVRNLYCKLLSIRPSTCKHVVVQQLMLKGRLPEITDPGMSVNRDPTDHCSESKLEQSKAIANSLPSAASSEPLAKAVNALTMMIHNVQSKIESSIQSSVGELQGTSYSQHQKLVEQISKLEMSVNEVKCEVEKMNGNLESLRKELKLQNHEKELNMITCHLDEMRLERNGVDKECIQNIIQNECKTMLNDIKERNETLYSQLKNDLILQLQNDRSFINSDPHPEENGEHSVSADEEM